jgi:hypothetical protein
LAKSLLGPALWQFGPVMALPRVDCQPVKANSGGRSGSDRDGSPLRLA